LTPFYLGLIKVQNSNILYTKNIKSQYYL
jgi:hypothetical protein